MLERFLSLSEDKGIGKFKKEVLSGASVACYSLPTPVKYLLAGVLRAKILYVAQNMVEANNAFKALSAYVDGEVVYLPAKPEVLISASVFSSESIKERYLAMEKIAMGNPCAIITTVEGLSDIFAPVNLYKERTFNLFVGQELSLQKLSAKLVLCGFTRCDMIENVGTFSIRGDIVDIMLSYGKAVRLDYFGDEIESIREIDVESMRSVKSVESVLITPCTESLYDSKDKDNIIKGIKSNLPKLDSREIEERILRISEEIIASVGDTFSLKQEVLPFCRYSTLFDYLDKETVIIFDEYNRLKDVALSVEREHQSRFEGLKKRGEVLSSQIRQKLPKDSLFISAKRFRSASLNSITTSDKGYNPTIIAKIKATPVPSYVFVEDDEICRDIKNWIKGGYSVVIAGETKEKSEKIAKDIVGKGGTATFLDQKDYDKFGCAVLPIFLEKGYILHEEKRVVIGTYDITKKITRKIVHKKRKKSDAFLTVEVGDFVVHDLHGIGKLRSVSTVKTGEYVRDFAIVEYKGGDLLYVPADEMESLVRFSGSEKTPTLSKIGGKDFSKIKEKVRASIREMAINLKELYGKRKTAVGYKYPEDSVFQKEFEEDFPYVDTPDQITATKEIKEDMCSTKVMDRLLVGDVGYGKTEVAFRAVFKCVESGRQACLLSPTTILSLQHFKTATERFKNAGIRIDYLNRFKTEKQVKQTLAALKEGKIDFIIATHRVLSKDVEFNDLGLLVLDEEQRFGVEDKEKIKELRKDIDVLSMSATPIPRTLHMSLTGMRDISVLETPPSKRIPPEVIVAEETDGIIADALIKEFSRGGQAFILYNKVNDIYSFAERIKNLVPDGKFIVAHGQMESRALESNIEKFVLGEYDCLIATTIIENGIDIPRANTMIVIDADNFGLSTAYQLKGRVGRSDKLAYVYFTYKENKVLTDNAYKRLQAIKEFTEFGSGFKIAMRDLEIRGSGNVLGKEQHGHMEKVGYDTYCKLLKDETDALEGKEVSDNTVEVDVALSCYIPEEYVKSSSARLELYSAISGAESKEDILDVLDKMNDIYGKVPQEVQNLCRLSLIKNALIKLFAKKLIVNEKRFEIHFTMNSLKNGRLLDLIEQNKNKVKLDFKDDVILSFYATNAYDGFNEIADFLAEIT
ncbi:MAG: transcription-repair coupling factor [Clostridia bacterium]|nr:transcription-repair coupling factor [Clostridia bacterium]